MGKNRLAIAISGAIIGAILVSTVTAFAVVSSPATLAVPPGTSGYVSQCADPSVVPTPAPGHPLRHTVSCPSGTTTTTSSSTTTTEPATTTTSSTTTTTQPSGGWQCSTSSLPDGSCPYYSGNANFTGPIIAQGGGNSVGEEVDQNDWSGSPDYTSATINANSPSNWQVVASAVNQGGAILAYPNQWDHIANAGASTEPVIDAQNQITYTFNETMPHNSATVGHFMMDNWADKWGYEIMIQVDFSNDGACSGSWPLVKTGITIDGQSWHLCTGNSGKSLDFKLGVSDGNQEQSESSGTIHVLDMLKWAEANGYLPTGSTLTALSSGYEIAGTGGTPESFTVNSSSLTSS